MRIILKAAISVAGNKAQTQYGWLLMLGLLQPVKGVSQRVCVSFDVMPS
ncbi:hypothetical protein B3286c1_0686 [Brucella vulpis]|nr:hypothetical protein BF3285c1_0687 [Brucella vulpis]CUW49517.1 hypothetical protein B3286c1_0686 [Brucella vulpis]